MPENPEPLEYRTRLRRYDPSYHDTVRNDRYAHTRRRECVRLMAEAVRLHVEGMRADGESVPEPSALAALVIPAA